MLILFGMFLSFSMAEIGIRILFNYDREYGPDYLAAHSLQYERNDFLGNVMKPNQVVEFENIWDIGSDARYEINRYGFRGPDVEFEKPANTIRIWVMGGSAAFDALTDEGQDWPRLLEQTIDLPSDTITIEVINAGVPGYNAYISYNRLLTDGWRFDPDIVVIYHCWNDLKYMARVDDGVLFSQLNDTDIPQLWRNYRDTHFISPLDRFLGNSHIYLRLRRGLKPDWLNAEASDLRDLIGTTEVGPVGSQQYRHHIEAIVDLSTRMGAVPVLVHQVHLPVSENTEQAKERIRYEFVGLDHEALVAAFAECDRQLNSVAEERGLLMIDETAVLDGTLDNLFDHVHTYPAGSRRLAEIVGEHLSPVVAQVAAAQGLTDE